jgi:pepF/M3 family oligoendopeptidase
MEVKYKYYFGSDSMQTTYNPTWDLDIIFPGGSSSEAFHTYIDNMEQEMGELSQIVSEFNPKQPDISGVVDKMEKKMKKLGETFAFVSCLSAQNVKDEKANLLVGKRNELKAEMGTIQTNFQQKLVLIDDRVWHGILKQPEIKELAFVLNEKREQAQALLPADQEILINDLAVDGYHAWGQMYDTLVGKMSVQLNLDGKVKSYSVGQAANMLSHPDRTVRKHVFEQLDQSWKEQIDSFEQTLNHLAGFRLQKYKHRNWHSILKEPLAINRMEKETLDAMWTAITNNKQHFVKYLQKKADLLGLDQLSMYDVGAPLTNTVKKLSYTDGAAFIVKHFKSFSPKMADFAEMAFEKRWIEAEDRAGKRPGGFCTSFPDSEQTRIFMTYSGSPSNVATLAHELGHAYHQHVMNDVNGLNQGYAMNVAETASTFAEMIVADASVKGAQNKAEKMALLDDKLQRSVAFFMNIHARFLFETRFYEERKQGMVAGKRLNGLMV